eukprot:1410724-Amphidinium_carterae.1
MLWLVGTVTESNGDREYSQISKRFPEEANQSRVSKRVVVGILELASIALHTTLQHGEYRKSLVIVLGQMVTPRPHKESFSRS